MYMIEANILATSSQGQIPSHTLTGSYIRRGRFHSTEHEPLGGVRQGKAVLLRPRHESASVQSVIPACAIDI